MNYEYLNYVFLAVDVIALGVFLLRPPTDLITFFFERLEASDHATQRECSVFYTILAGFLVHAVISSLLNYFTSIENNEEFRKQSFYIVEILLQCIIVFSIIELHAYKRVRLAKFSISIIAIALIQAVCGLIRYLDLLVLETNKLWGAYFFSMILMNFIIHIAIFVFTVSWIFYHRKSLELML